MKSTFLRATFMRANLAAAGPVPAQSYSEQAAPWWWMRVTAAIQAGVACVLRRDGWTVYHGENLLWHNLFGLLFSEELFESEQLHSGFDWVPHCLKDRNLRPAFPGTDPSQTRDGP